MVNFDLADVAVVGGLLVHTVTAIWWASKLTATQQNTAELLKELRRDFKQHSEEDRDFQLQIVRQLSERK